LNFDVTILTPEKTILTYRLAGLGSRVLAHFIDVVLLIGTLIAITFGVLYLSIRADIVVGQGILIFLYFAVPIVYFVLLEGLWNGQTLGKKACGIRVRMSSGMPVTFAAALGRNLMRPADLLPGPYLLGVIAMFTNPKSQRIGDLVADTIVCHERRPERRFAAAPHLVGVHPLESQVGDLRGMTIEEYNALRRFADRFPELSVPIQTRLLKEVWQPIAERRKVPALPNVHPIFLMEAVVMKYGRTHGLL
jgi:uncharacterized RDD family membrane protein YckC